MRGGAMTIEAVDPRARGLRPSRSRGRPAPLSVLARLDWLLLGATLARGRLRALGDRRHHAARPGRQRRTAARRSTPPPAGSRSSLATLIDPGLYRRFWQRDLRLPLLGDGVPCSSSARPRAARSGGSTSASSPSSRPSSARCCSRSRSRRSSPGTRKQIDRIDVPLKTIALALVPILLVFAQPDVGTALVYIAVARSPCSSSPGVRWLHLVVIAATGLVGRARRPLVAALRSGVSVLKPYQTASPASPSERSELLQPDQSMIAVGSGGLRGQGRQRRHPDGARLPAGARHRLRVRLARRAARLLRRLDPAPALPARRLAGPEDRHGRARPLRGDRRGRDRLRLPLPGVRQRRHDDGDRADHRASRCRSSPSAARR